MGSETRHYSQLLNQRWHPGAFVGVCRSIAEERSSYQSFHPQIAQRWVSPLRENALKIALRVVRIPQAKKTPRPRPTKEPIVACLDTFLAAASRVSRSDCRRLRIVSAKKFRNITGKCLSYSCQRCSSARRRRSSLALFLRAANDCEDVVWWRWDIQLTTARLSRGIGKPVRAES